jgi:O-antigen/teichoic acid export membrane protein
VASLASFIVGTATTLLQIPILLSVWSPERFGLWTIVMATYGLIVVADAGHQEYVCRRIVLAGISSTDRIRQLLGSAIRAAVLVAVLEVSIAALLAWSPLRVDGPSTLLQDAIDGRDASIALVAMVTYFATLGSVGGIMVRLYEANGNLSRSIWIGVFSRLASSAAVVTSALLGGSILTAATAHIVVGSVFAVFIFADIRLRFPQLWPWWQSGTLREGIGNLRKSLVLTAASGIEHLGSVLLLNLSGRLESPGATAAFATSRTVGNTLTQASSILLNPIVPELGRYFGRSDAPKVEATLSGATTISTIPICIGVTGIAALIPWVYESWTRNAVGFNCDLVAALIAAALVRQWQSPFAALLTASASTWSLLSVSVARFGVVLLIALVVTAGPDQLLVLGTAVLAGEVAGAATCLALGASGLRKLGGREPLANIALAALGVVITVAATQRLLAAEIQWYVAIPATLAGLGIILAIQVSLLPLQVQARIRALIRRSDRGAERL